MTDYKTMYECAAEFARSLIQEANSKDEEIRRLEAEIRELKEQAEELRFNPNHDPKNGRFTSGDGVDISGGSGIISSGAVSGAKKTSGWQDRHGERMYEEIRHRSTDVKRISECTPFKEKAVEEIKQHMFFKEHRFSNGTIRRFDPDFDQAQAWDRLTKGKGTATDIEMLKHEYVELTQMRIHGYDYETAHDIANSKHNWWAMVEKEK